MNSVPSAQSVSDPCRVVFLDAGTLPFGLPLTSDLLAGIDYTAHERSTPAEVAQRMAGTEIVLVNKVRLTAEHMANTPTLRCICVAAAGMDNVDLQAAAERGISVHNVPDYGSDAVAEHVIASLFALRRHLAEYSRAAADGRWSASPFFCWHGPRILPVGGSVLGIVGRGRIGQATARLARGLGVTVLFAQRQGRPAAPDERPLDALLAECDAISLHVPLTRDTLGLINAARLSLMKPDAVLINTGRGALVDAPALVDALQAGRLAGAAIDVLDTEPPPASHPLLAAGIPNLLLTPHVAWANEAAQQRLAGSLVARIAEHVAQRGVPGPSQARRDEA